MFNYFENSNIKRISTFGYNSVFDKRNGFHKRWGDREEDDPQQTPDFLGPELLDIEISSVEQIDKISEESIITPGHCLGNCDFCYKKNNIGTVCAHMSLETLRAILDCFIVRIVAKTNNKVMPYLEFYNPSHKVILQEGKIIDAKDIIEGHILDIINRGHIELCEITSVEHQYNVNQIAFGCISPIDRHPQLWDILRETRNRGIIPNLTLLGAKISDEVAANLSELCGAVAVSVNEKNLFVAYDTIKKLSQDYGISQINIHFVLANETLELAKQIVEDIKTDKRLEKLNAIVFLSFKDKQNTRCFTSISKQNYKELVDFCFKEQIRFGFDSCSANVFEEIIQEGKYDKKEDLLRMSEKCEATNFSLYLNYAGLVFACSFVEGCHIWEKGIPILEYNSITEVLKLPQIQEWRNILLSGGRKCPIYRIGE